MPFLQPFPSAHDDHDDDRAGLGQPGMDSAGRDSQITIVPTIHYEANVGAHPEVCHSDISLYLRLTQPSSWVIRPNASTSKMAKGSY